MLNRQKLAASQIVVSICNESIDILVHPDVATTLRAHSKTNEPPSYRCSLSNLALEKSEVHEC